MDVFFFFLVDRVRKMCIYGHWHISKLKSLNAIKIEVLKIVTKQHQYHLQLNYCIINNRNVKINEIETLDVLIISYGMNAAVQIAVLEKFTQK